MASLIPGALPWVAGFPSRPAWTLHWISPVPWPWTWWVMMEDRQWETSTGPCPSRIGVRDGPRQERYGRRQKCMSVSYTHLRAHETRHDLVCRLLLEKKKKKKKKEELQ